MRGLLGIGVALLLAAWAAPGASADACVFYYADGTCLPVPVADVCLHVGGYEDPCGVGVPPPQFPGPGNPTPPTPPAPPPPPPDPGTPPEGGVECLLNAPDPPECTGLPA